MKKVTKDWLTSANSDLLLIEKIIGEESISHLAAFHAQQAIEKSMKAIIEEFDLGFIKTHSLETLYNRCKERIHFVADDDLLILLDQLYIDARYPGELGLLPHGKPSFGETKAFFNLASQFFKAAETACV